MKQRKVVATLCDSDGYRSYSDRYVQSRVYRSWEDGGEYSQRCPSIKCLAPFSYFHCSLQSYSPCRLRVCWRESPLSQSCVVENSDVVIFSVKPQEWAGHSRFIRVMPNTPAAVGEADSVMSLGGAATEEDGNLIAKLFGSVGKIWKAEEKFFDAITGLRHRLPRKLSWNYHVAGLRRSDGCVWMNGNPGKLDKYPKLFNDYMAAVQLIFF